jgi:hypothetical protein
MGAAGVVVTACASPLATAAVVSATLAGVPAAGVSADPGRPACVLLQAAAAEAAVVGAVVLRLHDGRELRSMAGAFAYTAPTATAGWLLAGSILAVAAAVGSALAWLGWRRGCRVWPCKPQQQAYTPVATDSPDDL